LWLVTVVNLAAPVEHPLRLHGDDANEGHVTRRVDVVVPCVRSAPGSDSSPPSRGGRCPKRLIWWFVAGGGRVLALGNGPPASANGFPRVQVVCYFGSLFVGCRFPASIRFLLQPSPICPQGKYLIYVSACERAIRRLASTPIPGRRREPKGYGMKSTPDRSEPQREAGARPAWWCIPRHIL
jgi:hypothetical protein